VRSGEREKGPPFPDQDPEIGHGSHGMPATRQPQRNHEPMRPTRIEQQTRIQEPPIQERARKVPPLMAEEVEEKKNRGKHRASDSIQSEDNVLTTRPFMSPSPSPLRRRRRGRGRGRRSSGDPKRRRRTPPVAGKQKPKKMAFSLRICWDTGVKRGR